jgi:non-ribosomal peptide synthetase component E (peptide arylation enzyme)
MLDPRLGEKACAFVVAKEGQEPTLDELVAYLRERGIAPYKWPERLELTAELPTTPSGKIKKFVLEQALQRELEPNRG